VHDLLTFRKALKPQYSIFVSYGFVIACILGSLVGCKSDLKRPYGFVRVGKVDSFNLGQTWLKQFRLVVNRDKLGIFVMSTECTFDGTPLNLITVDDSFILKSSYSDSSYSNFGKVLTGPAKSDLPYYKTLQAAEKLGGAIDTLYVVIGSEVGEKWRMSYNDSKALDGWGFFKELNLE
jgi:nitrite reductase/ring-hydroxylating ferredoxin subunit